MEKSCPGQEGHPPSRVNFTERLYEKNVDPIARAKSTENRARACSECLTLTELTRLGEPKCLQLFQVRLCNKTVRDNTERYCGLWGSWSLIQALLVSAT